MFKNAEYDPLTIPSRGISRRSVGPSHRVASTGNRTAGAYDDARRDEPFDGRFEHSQVQEYPQGSGQGWMPTPGGPSHLHPVHGPYTPNTQEYPGPHPTNAIDKPIKREVGAPMGASPLPRPVAKILDREARSFMDAEGNTDDRSELLYRARRHASTLTSTWSPDAAHKVTEAFCGRVAAMIPNRPRVAAAQPVTMFADFDDALLY